MLLIIGLYSILSIQLANYLQVNILNVAQQNRSYSNYLFLRPHKFNHTFKIIPPKLQFCGWKNIFCFGKNSLMSS